MVEARSVGRRGVSVSMMVAAAQAIALHANAAQAPDMAPTGVGAIASTLAKPAFARAASGMVPALADKFGIEGRDCAFRVAGTLGADATSDGTIGDPGGTGTPSVGFACHADCHKDSYYYRGPTYVFQGSTFRPYGKPGYNSGLNAR